MSYLGLHDDDFWRQICVASPLASIALRQDVSSFVEGDTVTLQFSPETKWPPEKHLIVLIPDEHKDLCNN